MIRQRLRQKARGRVFAIALERARSCPTFSLRGLNGLLLALPVSCLTQPAEWGVARGTGLRHRFTRDGRLRLAHYALQFRVASSFVISKIMNLLRQNTSSAYQERCQACSRGDRSRFAFAVAPAFEGYVCYRNGNSAAGIIRRSTMLVQR